MTAVDTPPIHLSDYRGYEVLGATVSIRNTGDGLSQAMSVAPVELDLRSTVFVVLECEVEKHRYDPIKDTDAYQLVNMLKAGRATLVDADVVAHHLDAQQRRIEESEGTMQLDLDGTGGGGEPQAIGDVLNDAIDLADVAEDDATRRHVREKELDAFDKPGLLELAKSYDLAGRHELTKAELVVAIVDHEETHGRSGA